jgi:hypothetical protein
LFSEKSLSSVSFCKHFLFSHSRDIFSPWSLRSYNTRRLRKLWYSPLCGVLLVTVTEWYRTKRPVQLRPFSDASCSPSEFYSFPVYPPEFPVLVAAHTLSSGAGVPGREMAAEFCLSVSLSYLKGSLTSRKILLYVADGFNSQKEVVLRIFIDLKTHLSRPGLNPRNLVPMASTITITPPRTTCVRLTTLYTAMEN